MVDPVKQVDMVRRKPDPEPPDKNSGKNPLVQIDDDVLKTKRSDEDKDTLGFVKFLVCAETSEHVLHRIQNDEKPSEPPNVEHAVLVQEHPISDFEKKSKK